MPELPDPKYRLHPFHIPPPSEGGGEGVGGERRHSNGFTPTPALPLRGEGRSAPAYAELHVTSNFTFLSGASHPEEYVLQARELGHCAIAITDVNSLAGIVRAHIAAKNAGVQFVVGCRLEVENKRRSDEATERRRDEGPCVAVSPQASVGYTNRQSTIDNHQSLSLLLYPTDRDSYGRLCRLLTLGKRRAVKGECHLALHDVIEHHKGLLAAIVPPRILDQHFLEVIEGLARVFDDDRFSIASSCLYGEDDHARLRQLIALSEHTGVPLVATNDVHYHMPERRALQDVLTCIRHTCTIQEAGFRLFPHAERYLKTPQEMARLFAAHPQALSRTIAIAERARGFNLDQLRYEYPHEVCPPGRTPMEYLIELTWKGAVERYGEGQKRQGDEETKRQSAPDSDSSTSSLRLSISPSLRIPPDIRSLLPPHLLTQILHEFEIIESLNYAPYFLTCYDIVTFARSQNILCQGRGAAANSAVCYCLSITAVDPATIDLLFERFVSRERNEPPDIDIDFEHERREEVIQYIYKKYGRDRAALTAEVITYRGRSAIRDVGKGLGLSLDLVDRLAKSLDWWDNGVVNRERLREMGVNPDDSTVQHLCALANEILGFPRHLSQHVGGFVLTRGPLCESVPIENAAMADRTVIEWDKDDIDALGMLKVDVLGLGMLTCIAKGFRFVEQARRHEGTKARRQGETAHQRNQRSSSAALHPLSEGICHEHHQDFSRPHCLAEVNGTGAGHVRRDGHDATNRTIRPDLSDPEVGRVDSLEHRRGICAGEDSRLSETSATCSRFYRGAFDSNGAGCQHEHDLIRSEDQRSPCGNGSSSAGPDSQYQSESAEGMTPCLCASVPSCLPALALHTIPPDDPAVYEMLCHADSVGVFQVESRAQMTMLPRLRPRCFYDLVIEVAIVRPGPIQGDMVHPYLRRRNREEEVHYPNPHVERILKKTLGVPLFQEQAMQLAITAAGFTPGEADQLRRAIAAWRRKRHLIQQLGVKLVDGMLARGYTRDFAERCFDQIKGFSEYGFPESHAASFAHLVYVSAWLKCHYPAAFAAALLNSQPMGFYAPAQIVRDAQEHGVEVRPVDVNFSEWDCTLEEKGLRNKGTKGQKEESDEETETVSPAKPHAMLDNHHIAKSPLHHFTKSDLSAPLCLSGCISDSPALRLGMRQVRGLREEDGRAIANAVKEHGPFQTIESLRSYSGMRLSALKKLAAADAFRSMGLDRQHALWMLRELRDEELPLFDGTKGRREKIKRRRDKETERRSVEKDAEPEEHSEEGPGGPLNRQSVSLPHIAPARQVIQDYSSVGLSLKAHPISFIREELNHKRVMRNIELKDEKRWPNGKPIAVAGLTLVRQRPGTASGVVFITIEDETGIANLIVRPKIYEQFRNAARHATILIARGKVERQGEVVHVMVRSLEMLDESLRDIVTHSRDFH